MADPIEALFSQLEDAIAAEEGQGTPMALKVARYNRMVSLAARYVGLPHPALCPQLVKIDSVDANAYNPNKVAPPEMRLLRLSILRDGLTMPVVVCPEGRGRYTTVDGFHRTTTVRDTPAIRASTAGYLPVVRLVRGLEERMASTVRHNMARGSHQVELSARLVTALRRASWSDARIAKEFGMDPDEVLRLQQLTGLADAYGSEEFSNAWE